MTRFVNTLLLITCVFLANICLAGEREDLLKALNKDLPKMYNENIEINSIELDGDNMIFNYRMVNVLKDEVNEEKLTTLKSEIQQSACTEKSSKDLLSHGIILNYVFKDKKNMFIDKKIVAPADCE